MQVAMHIYLDLQVFKAFVITIILAEPRYPVSILEQPES
jgi:hypothetical protein